MVLAALSALVVLAPGLEGASRAAVAASEQVLARQPALHLTLRTSRGPVHVFRPAGYEPSTAGTVVYVHGYYTDLRGACRHHDLRGQFTQSRRNALFIVPEAPANHRQKVLWPSLEALLDEVRASGLELPSGKTVAVAHSGGFRTVASWLPEGRVDSVVLLDGLYGNDRDFTAWLEGDVEQQRRLLLVGFNTTPQIERFVSRFDDTVVVPAIPLRPVPDELKAARLVFLRSQFGHMELVTERRALPAVLRLTRLPPLVPPA